MTESKNINPIRRLLKNMSTRSCYFLVSLLGFLVLIYPFIIYASERAVAPTESSVNYAIGKQRALIFLAKFLDSPAEPATPKEVRKKVFNGQVQKFYKEQSYGKTWFVGKVMGWNLIPKSSTKPDGSCNYLDGDDLTPFLQSSAVDLSLYDHLIIIYNFSYCIGSALSTVGKAELMLGGKAYSISTTHFGYGGFEQKIGIRGLYTFPWTEFDNNLSHELGHSLGLVHAGAMECGVGRSIGGGDVKCEQLEAGNGYDSMGPGTHSLHFNAFFKKQLGWLDKYSILDITQSGVYEIKSLENQSGVRAARIKPISFKSFPIYLEKRAAEGFDAYLGKEELRQNTNGLMINYIIYPYSRLIDASPQSSSWYSDNEQVALVANNIFEDPGLGVRIGPILNVSNSSVTFNVTLTSPTCIHRRPKFIAYPFQRIENGISLSFSLENKNDTTCPISAFEVKPSWPEGWRANVINAVILPPLGKDSFTFNIALSDEAVRGKFTIPVIIKDNTVGRSYAKNSFVVNFDGSLSKENYNYLGLGLEAVNQFITKMRKSYEQNQLFRTSE